MRFEWLRASLEPAPLQRSRLARIIPRLSRARRRPSERQLAIAAIATEVRTVRVGVAHDATLDVGRLIFDGGLPWLADTGADLAIVPSSPRGPSIRKIYLCF